MKVMFFLVCMGALTCVALGLCAPATYAGVSPVLTCSGTGCSGLSQLGNENVQDCQCFCCPIAGSGYYYSNTCSSSAPDGNCCTAGANACTPAVCTENCFGNGYPNY